MKNATKTEPMRVRIEADIEDTGPYATVVDVLHAEASKPVTTRLAAKVAATLSAAYGPGDYDVRITRFAGMTHVEWGGYSRSQGNRGHSILLAHTERSEPIAQRYLDDMDRFLAAKHERNARRRALLASDAPERMDAARQAVREAAAVLAAIHDEGENYSVLPSASTMIEEVLS